MQSWTSFGRYFVAPLYDQVLNPPWEFVYCLYEIVVHPTREAVGEVIESVVIGVPKYGTFFQFCQEICTLERTSAQLLVSQTFFLTVVLLTTLLLRPGALPLILSVTRAPLPSPTAPHQSSAPLPHGAPPGLLFTPLPHSSPPELLSLPPPPRLPIRTPLRSPSPTAPLLLAAQLLLPSLLCWQWDPVGQMKFRH